MRDAKLIKKLVDDAIPLTGGKMPLDLLAVNEEEAGAMRALLKGRHHAGSITVRVAKSGELQPNMHWR
jgi:hypothetical protein